MSVVTPQKVGSTGSLLIHFTEPVPGKFRAPFFNKGRFAAAGIMLLAVFLCVPTVYSFIAGDVWRAVVGVVFVLLTFASSFQCYYNWFNDQERKYVKEDVVPFFNSQVFAPASAWLGECGLLNREGRAPLLFDDGNSERLYYGFNRSEDMNAGSWVRSYEVASDGSLVDSGKGYVIGFSPAGKDTIRVTYEVVDNSDDT